LLDVVESLHDVVKVLGGGVADVLALPVAERVDKAARICSVLQTDFL